MRPLVFHVLVISNVIALRRVRPFRAYPQSEAGAAALQSPSAAPVRVWESGSFFAQNASRTTERTPWVNSSASKNLTCDGYLRYGNSDYLYSPPIIASVVNESCNLSRLRRYLWNVPADYEAGTCKCRRPIPMTLVQKQQDEMRCFAAPSSLNGWPFPGLVDCTASSDQITQLVYHPDSGQLRSGGNCLTASPNNPSGPIYSAWMVKFTSCLGYVDPSNRQAWDVAEGVGEQQIYMKFEDKLKTQLGDPMGHLGRIVLRDSSDIGKRCLDLAYDFPAIPSPVPVVFLKAITCSDVRFDAADYAVWRFYQAVPRTEAYAMNQWMTCNNKACTDCADGQLKVVFVSGNDTDAISVPGTYSFGQTCDVNTLREMALPGVLDSASNSTCFCQKNALFGLSQSGAKISSLLGPNSDDLPSTAKAAFPARNVSSKSS